MFQIIQIITVLLAELHILQYIYILHNTETMVSWDLQFFLYQL